MNLHPRILSEPSINLTSLIDVVFLLLIFFMVSTSFTKESEMKITLPQAEVETPASIDPSIEIVITADGKYFLNDRELINSDPATLREAISREVGEDRNMPITIRADGNATHQSVVAAMDVAGRLGFANLNIVTVTPDKN
ncbi:MAG: biopolymer transporter ExbD [Gammaproteobacteria bacterium]|nr:biopolymer transporter ExbD [Gammaproteobacteria bacterium]NNC98412.1 biopolymer transporter ExbD [Gammaproteobacteria bacterium]NNM13888.1 biopolymer transporter ExbD [Gammaproteobacteria bacterium]